VGIRVLKDKILEYYGYQGINMELMKYGGILFTFQLLCLLNVLETKHRIKRMDIAVVLYIFKKGKISDCCSYRRIIVSNGDNLFQKCKRGDQIKRLPEVQC
jgi:hypothetical protein